jgi:hypothetical protein
VSRIEWRHLFAIVAERGKDALEWAFPEWWIQVELYAELRRRQSESGWTPIGTEPPYATWCPVGKLKEKGAGKLADICCHDETRSAWDWLELKARPVARGVTVAAEAHKAATDFARDAAAMVGIDMQRTADKWASLPRHSKKSRLSDLAGDLLRGGHRFTAAYVQIGGELDAAIWTENAIGDPVERRLDACRKVTAQRLPFPQLTVVLPTAPMSAQCQLVLAQWTCGPS